MEDVQASMPPFARSISGSVACRTRTIVCWTRLGSVSDTGVCPPRVSGVLETHGAVSDTAGRDTNTRGVVLGTSGSVPIYIGRVSDTGGVVLDTVGSVSSTLGSVSMQGARAGTWGSVSGSDCMAPASPVPRPATPFISITATEQTKNVN